VKSTVETLSPTRVRLEIEVPFAELEPSLKKAYREIGQQVTIPGFRRGKVPSTVIDQRIGRNTVINEAIQEVIPAQILAAVREHDVKTLGRPEVAVQDVTDGEPLKFTAEVDVRPEFTLPEFGEIDVTVDALAVSDEEIDEQIAGLRERFSTLKTVDRAALTGDYVQIDLEATVDGELVPGGSVSNFSHEVGSGKLIDGLDEALQGLAAGGSTTFTSQLVGDQAGKDADVKVTVRTVKEKQLPELDDSFAQLASEFDTLDEVRDDIRTRLTRVKRAEQLYAARDAALKAIVEATDVPTPEGVVRDEVEHRKETLNEQFEQIGTSLEHYLEREGKTEADIDAELTESATEAIRAQLVLDAFADAEKVTVSDEEFGHEVVHRAQRAGMQPQQYYEQLVQAGVAGSVFGDVRRGKALALVLERVKIKDSEGNPLTLAELQASAQSAEDDHEGHDHEGHDHD
jgi:trigger factor